MKVWIGSLFLLLMVEVSKGQETKVFSLSPMSTSTAAVNGLVLGVGHVNRDHPLQEINGVNIDVMLLSPIIMLYLDPNQRRSAAVNLVSRGLNIGLGGYYEGTIHYGASISCFNMSNETHGLGIQFCINSMEKANGLFVSGIGNYAEEANGICLAIVNKVEDMNGLQIGLYNKSKMTKGLQLGIVNRSKRTKGLQIGIINTNSKRTLPFINF